MYCCNKFLFNGYSMVVCEFARGVCTIARGVNLIALGVGPIARGLGPSSHTRVSSDTQLNYAAFFGQL